MKFRGIRTFRIWPAHAVPLLLMALATGCHSEVAWIPDTGGKLRSVHTDTVKLPGLTYLQLGARQGEVAYTLRQHGFDCSEEAQTGTTLACTRLPGEEEPTGGVVMLLFEHAVLAGVQAQLQPAGDPGGKLARVRYADLMRDWTRDYGHPIEISRPGVKMTRFNLRNGTALYLAYYDHEPDVIHVEHSKFTGETVALKAAPRDSGIR